MRIGMIYPQTEYGNDPAAIRDYAQTAEDLGFTHLLAYDHILGENAAIPAQGYRPYTHLSAFQEPFVLSVTWQGSPGGWSSPPGS